MRGPECGSHVKTRHFRTGGAAAPRENSETDLDFFLLPRWRAPHLAKVTRFPGANPRRGDPPAQAISEAVQGSFPEWVKAGLTPGRTSTEKTRRI